MQWTKVDKYQIKCGTFLISKYFSRDNVRYGLSNNNKNIGYYDSIDDAKLAAEKENKIG
jgi:DNA-dependent RNA polymerase auxiliary subunit epsilon